MNLIASRILAVFLFALLASISHSQSDIQSQFEAAIRKADFSIVKDYGWKNEVNLSVKDGLLTKPSSEAVAHLSRDAKGMDVQTIEFGKPYDTNKSVTHIAEMHGPGERTYHFSCEALKEGDQFKIRLVTFLETTGANLVNLIDDEEELKPEPIEDIFIEKTRPESTTEQPEDDETVYMIVDEMPASPGCEELIGDRRRECSREKVSDYIVSNLEYPEQARADKKEGTVYISYEIGKTGDVQNAEVIRGADPVLDKAALQVVRSLPKHKPGSQRGTPVIVRFTVPVRFEL